MAYKDGVRAFDGGPYKVGEKLTRGGGVMAGNLLKRGCGYGEGGEGEEVILTRCEIVENSGFRGHLQNLVLSTAGFWSDESIGPAVKLPSALNMDSVLLFWKFGVGSEMSRGRVILDASGQGLHEWEGGNQGYVAETGVRLVVGTPKLGNMVDSDSDSDSDSDPNPGTFPCGEIYKNIWHFQGPQGEWSGDLRAAYGGRLQFKMKASSWSGSERSGRGKVVLVGRNGDSVSYKSKFEAPKGDWVFYSVVLRPDHGFVNEPGGELTDEARMKGILGDLDRLLIRGDDYVYGAEGIGMEVVVLNDVVLYAK